MRRSVKSFLTPGWITLHVVVWAAAVTMVFLGRWQLDVSNTKHFDLQNFGYALQWWAFSAAAVFFWLRAMRDAWRPPKSKTAPTGQVVLRRGQPGGVGGRAYAGPAQLVAPPSEPGGAPVVYRGYVMPQSATSIPRSGGDALHGAYNDHLWQLGLADGQRPEARRQSGAGSGSASAESQPGVPADDIGQPDTRAIEPGT